MSQPVYVVDLFAKIVADTQTAVLPILQAFNPAFTGVNFQAGHRLEISNTLLEWSKNSKDADKFPMIALMMDFPEENGGIGNPTNLILQFAIATLTQPDWKLKDRNEKTLYPILYPIYHEFLRQIYYCGYFINSKAPKNIKIDRPLWGLQGANGNTGNFFNDKVDIIEIQNLKLTTYGQCRRALGTVNFI